MEGGEDLEQKKSERSNEVFSVLEGVYGRKWYIEKEREFGKCKVSQTSFNLYLHNQWTDFHKPSCAGKPQIKVICIYVGCTKATTKNWDIRSSVTEKSLFANISWTAGQIHTIKLALESAYQTISNDIWYIL